MELNLRQLNKYVKVSIHSNEKSITTNLSSQQYKCIYLQDYFLVCLDEYIWFFSRIST